VFLAAIVCEGRVDRLYPTVEEPILGSFEGCQETVAEQVGVAARPVEPDRCGDSAVVGGDLVLTNPTREQIGSSKTQLALSLDVEIYPGNQLVVPKNFARAALI
jgi:hypothetical protein